MLQGFLRNKLPLHKCMAQHRGTVPQARTYKYRFWPEKINGSSEKWKKPSMSNKIGPSLTRDGGLRHYLSPVYTSPGGEEAVRTWLLMNPIVLAIVSTSHIMRGGGTNYQLLSALQFWICIAEKSLGSKSVDKVWATENGQN